MANVALVSIQLLKGTAGNAAMVAQVENAVKAFNAANKGAAHIVDSFDVLPKNEKGMQFALALCATVARVNGANMIRLGVHGGSVALCGPREAVNAVKKQFPEYLNQYRALALSTYNPSTHGNKVGYDNGFTCGTPAGLQVAAKVTTAMAYGVGTLFTFPVPGDGKSYAIGQAAAAAAYSPKAAKVKTVKATKPAQAAAPSANAELDLLNAQERELA